MEARGIRHLPRHRYVGVGEIVGLVRMVTPSAGLKHGVNRMRSANLLLIFSAIFLFPSCSAEKTATISAAVPAQAASSEPSSKPLTQDYVASGPLVVENQVDVAALREG